MTIPLYLPRRHRRPLLFPPGLLALAWLLWLGCVTLPRMRGMEKPQVVVHLTMPPVHAADSSPYPIVKLGWVALYSSPFEIEKFRPWQTLAFSGNLWADYFTYKQTETNIIKLHNAANQAKGLRIRFASQAPYRALVCTLDLLNQYEITKYWVDIWHSPTTLYAFTSVPNKIKSSPPELMPCGGNRYIEPPTIISHNLPTWITSLVEPNILNESFYWRNSTILLLLLASTSVIRLYRQHWTG
ncbi:hypothetical protein [Hymenobacter volaticus]|uniref:DUF4105 domain-containing protein n=1 Tax=Hymenobacter volaticus TaxID=2932254 RepID=A0ABY4G9G0_9BACT|nr:hypothetical protein [Hymenobacter volaticus]UOQ67545.1 hypothetical protein MUN86_06640 [Hymenobacter volaticus]